MAQATGAMWKRIGEPILKAQNVSLHSNLQVGPGLVAGGWTGTRHDVVAWN